MFTPLMLSVALVFGSEPGRSSMYRDVASKVNANKRTELTFSNTITSTHEITHEINHVNSKPGYQALYTGNNSFHKFPIPKKVKLIDVNKFVPENLRNHRFETYVEKQSTDRWETIDGSTLWIRGRNDNPLYLLDEWVSYNNGAKAGLEEAALDIYMEFKSDLFLAPLEMGIYAVGLYKAIQEIEPEYLSKNPDFTKFMKSETNRALKLFNESQKNAKLKWDSNLPDKFIASDLCKTSAIKIKKETDGSLKQLP